MALGFSSCFPNILCCPSAPNVGIPGWVLDACVACGIVLPLVLDLATLSYFCLTSSSLVCNQSSRDSHLLVMTRAPLSTAVHLSRTWTHLAPVSSPLQELEPCPNIAFWWGFYNIWAHLPDSWVPPAWLPRAHPLLCPVLPDWTWCPRLLESCLSLLYNFQLGFVLALSWTNSIVHLLGSSSTGPMLLIFNMFPLQNPLTPQPSEGSIKLGARKPVSLALS